MLTALKIPFEERPGERIQEPEDEIDHEMFLKIAQNGGNPASPEFPQEIDVDIPYLETYRDVQGGA